MILINSGWNNKNTVKFGFDENGNHIIFNLDGEILDEKILQDSPLCKLQWEWFKEAYPTKQIYEEKTAELENKLYNMSKEDKNKLVEQLVEKILKI